MSSMSIAVVTHTTSSVIRFVAVLLAGIGVVMEDPSVSRCVDLGHGAPRRLGRTGCTSWTAERAVDVSPRRAPGITHRSRRGHGAVATPLGNRTHPLLPGV